MKICKKKSHQYSEHSSQCPECCKAYQKDYYAENRDELREYKKDYYTENRGEIRECQKAYKVENKDEAKSYQKAYYSENGYKNRDKIKAYRAKPEIKAQANNRQKARRASEPLYKLSQNLRNSIGKSFKNKGWKKSSRTEKILGCGYNDLRTHLISTAIKNYGIFDPTLSYEIDHIVPISLARNEEEMIKLNHHTNLQYLTKVDNIAKSDKVFDSNNIEIKDLDRKVEVLEKVVYYYYA